jgi:hypothetical protein
LFDLIAADASRKEGLKSWIYILARFSHIRLQERIKEVYMTKTQMLKKIAKLESINDHLSTELGHIDHLMRLAGFAGGIATVKATATEIITKGLTGNNNLNM